MSTSSLSQLSCLLLLVQFAFAQISFLDASNFESTLNSRTRPILVQFTSPHVRFLHLLGMHSLNIIHHTPLLRSTATVKPTNLSAWVMVRMFILQSHTFLLKVNLLVSKEIVVPVTLLKYWHSSSLLSPQVMAILKLLLYQSFVTFQMMNCNLWDNLFL